MGIPIIIPTSKESFKQWIKLVGVILIAAAIYFSATKIQFKQPNFIKEGTVPFSEMNKTDVYEASDIIIFDNYATYTNNDYIYEYCSILIKDSDGYSKYATLLTSVKDDVYSDVMAFQDDLTLNYGECVLTGGFTALKMDDVKMESESLEKLKKFFSEDVSNCQQVFNAEETDLVFSYACASEADFPNYKEYIKSENIKWGGIAAALIAGGVICIVIGVLMSKKSKKKAIESAEANAYYYNPEADSEVYYTPDSVSENVEATPVQQECVSAATDTYSVLPDETSNLK